MRKVVGKGGGSDGVQESRAQACVILPQEDGVQESRGLDTVDLPHTCHIGGGGGNWRWGFTGKADTMVWICDFDRDEHMLFHAWLSGARRCCVAPRWCLVAPVPSWNRRTLPLRLSDADRLIETLIPGFRIVAFVAENEFLFKMRSMSMTVTMTMSMTMFVALDLPGREDPFFDSLSDWDPWPSIRVGEAAHPGPRNLVSVAQAAGNPLASKSFGKFPKGDYSIMMVNPGSLRPHAAEVTSCGADVIGVVEHGIARASEKPFWLAMHRMGYNTRYGKSVAAVKGSSCSAGPGKGVLLSSRGPPLRLTKLPEGITNGDTPWLYSAIHPLSNGLSLVVIIVYGTSKVGTQADQQNESLFNIALDLMVQFQGQPTIVMGDFNRTPENSQTMALFGQYGLFDLAVEAERRFGEMIIPTCYDSVDGTRLDRIYANELCLRAFTSFRSGFVGQIRTHMAVGATFSWKRLNQDVPRPVLPRLLKAVPDKKLVAVFEKDYWDDDNEQKLWTAAIEENVDELYTTWSGVTEELLLRAARENGEVTSSKHRGRGRKHVTIPRPQYSMKAKTARNGDFEPQGVNHDLCTRQLTKQMRRLEKYYLLVQCLSDQNREEADQTWRSILKSGSYPGFRRAQDFFAWKFRATPGFGWELSITDLDILRFLMNATEQIIKGKIRLGAKEKSEKFRERLYGDKSGALKGKTLRDLPHPPLSGIQGLDGQWHTEHAHMRCRFVLWNFRPKRRENRSRLGAGYFAC